MNPYVGHDSQVYRVEEHRLVGGKGDGMRLVEVSNGLGIELTITPDRCADISRLSFRGINMSYFAPCGYVAPAFYDDKASGFLKSFTAGFLTTCGLRAVGTPCADEGEELPLHGTIANAPAERVYWTEEGDFLAIRAQIDDAALFAPKLRLCREIRVSLKENAFAINDRIINAGDKREPLLILYHMNMGYPLLDEDSVITIPSAEVEPRDAHAAEDLANWMKIIPPQAGYVERCYYHRFADGNGRAAIWQPKLGQGLEISFDSGELDGFVEWKMMGVRDYVLGLECGNCYPDGRAAMRKLGMLKFLDAGEEKAYEVRVALKAG